ncbi:MAG: ester cyclase [Candidatus Aminicenantes bacterium]|nr:ester cyclase [Candidatus Aminicenantes bacterium]
MKVSWSDPAMPYGPIAGKASVREFCENILKAFPDFAYQLRESVCISPSGERCAIPWEISATHLGRFDPMEFAPTNQTITMQGVDLVEFRGNRITRTETLFNIMSAAEQALRLDPFPKRGIKRFIIVILQRILAWWLRRLNRQSK